jgi:hypothetical protein
MLLQLYIFTPPQGDILSHKGQAKKSENIVGGRWPNCWQIQCLFFNEN